MNKIVPCFCVIVACLSLHARSEGVVGLAAGEGQWPSDACSGSCDRRDTVWSARAGWMFSPYIGLEARYVDLGRARSSQTFTDVTINSSIAARGAGVGALLALPIAHGLRLTAAGGVTRMKTSFDRPDADVASNPGEGILTVAGFHSDVTRTRPYYGVGVDYDVAPNVSAGVEAARYRVGQ